MHIHTYVNIKWATRQLAAAAAGWPGPGRPTRRVDKFLCHSVIQYYIMLDVIITYIYVYVHMYMCVCIYIYIYIYIYNTFM